MWYSKSQSYIYCGDFKPLDPEYIEKEYKYTDEEGRRYRSARRSEKSKYVVERDAYYLDEAKGIAVSNLWDDISHIASNAPENVHYPTQKPEALLERIIKASSKPGDLVLDCFPGSGTTLAVAEKLGRRWIGVDCGKLAIYTMQKRLLNIADSKDLENPKRKYSKQCKPFTLYNAGLYDYKMIKELPWEQYRDFALKLFQCRDEKHEISRIELDGFLGADSVLVFNYQKYKDAMIFTNR